MKRNIKIADQIIFLRRLGMFVGSGISLAESLKLMKGQRNKLVNGLLEELTIKTNGGISLSRALHESKYNLNKIALSLLVMGEGTGKLSESLMIASKELSNIKLLRNKLLSILFYPGIITVMILTLIAVMSWYILPKLSNLFTSMDIELPLITRIMIKATSVMSHHPLLILFIIITMALLLLVSSKNTNIKKVVQYVFLKTPFLSRILKKYHLSNICRMVGSMIEAGLPLHKSIKLCAENVSNYVYKFSLLSIYDDITHGKSLSYSFKKFSQLYHDLLIQLVKSGEATGSVSQNLLYVSNFYKQELEEFSQRMNIIIEPIIMIVIGLIVGFMALAIMLPIYNLSSHVSG